MPVMVFWKVTVVGVRDGFISLPLADSEESFLKTTVLQLKEKIHENAQEVSPSAMRLHFAGKQLEDKDRSSKAPNTFEHYNVQNGSTIELLLRLPGGSDKDNYRVQAPPVVHKKHDTSDCSLKFTTREPDAIAGVVGPSRVRMSCGCAVDPNSLTRWCRELIGQGKFKFHCPAKVEGGQKICQKEWSYAEVRKSALLTPAECKYFESRLSEYAAEAYCDQKKCPGCRTSVERATPNNLQVRCIICKKVFCWHCLKNWSGPQSATKCGNPTCQHPDLPSIQDSPRFTLNGEQVPLRRACPTCGKVAEHSQEGCKMVACPRCATEYCFMCLKLKKTCLAAAPASQQGKCANPVAPIQTSIPVWSQP